ISTRRWRSSKPITGRRLQAAGETKYTVTFSISHTDSQTSARCGVVTTAHGAIETPIFMPVGTAATVKAVHQRELQHDIGAQIILANTYHLYLRPGIDLLRRVGGVHQFNGWPGPVLTDS